MELTSFFFTFAKRIETNISYFMKRKVMLLLLFVASSMPILAQMGDGQNGQMASEGTSFFVPHWYIKAQGGAAYDVGEAKFSQLLSPSQQLAMGYKFNEYFGLRD